MENDLISIFSKYGYASREGLAGHWVTREKQDSYFPAIIVTSAFISNSRLIGNIWSA